MFDFQGTVNLGFENESSPYFTKVGNFVASRSHIANERWGFENLNGFYKLWGLGSHNRGGEWWDEVLNFFLNIEKQLEDVYGLLIFTDGQDDDQEHPHNYVVIGRFPKNNFRGSSKPQVN